jgi:predicted permease
MCVLLLAVASLFLRGLASARGVDPGFNAQGIIDTEIDLRLVASAVMDTGEAAAALRAAQRAETFNAVLRRAALLPGARSATYAAVVPLGGSNMETVIAPEGMKAASRRDYPRVYFNVVAPRFFETLRTPILRGREFLDSDNASAPRVAIINESAARRLWPDGDALGKRFHWGSVDGPTAQIVGISRDANYVMPGESPKTTVYVPLAQEPRTDITLLISTSADLVTTRSAVWAMLREVVPTMPPPAVSRMTDDMAVTLLPVRMGAALVGAFGLIALILASAGIYGVAAYSVASRTREIGVRAALGATRQRIVRMVLWESGRRVAIGAVIGLIATVGVGFGLSRVMFGVRPVDPVVILGVAAVISAVALLATLAPARRAAKADPVVAMRAE